ncbi:zinc finger BED domain-containing protein 6-like [Ranitomeya variabilis]|uniref:zinc finger BED domain-containing protein 6-like n=1 Tax=Ranitomeya variabilis TaxID=490064 RepID=UPI004056706D
MVTGSYKGPVDIHYLWRKRQFHHLNRPAGAPAQQSPSLTCDERVERMLQEYLELNINTIREGLDPFTFWSSKMEEWPEHASHALEVLSCPAASVLSECVFSAAGGVLSDKCIWLSPDSVDGLTVIKMNKSLISKDFCTPIVDCTH